MIIAHCRCGTGKGSFVAGVNGYVAKSMAPVKQMKNLKRLLSWFGGKNEFQAEESECDSECDSPVVDGMQKELVVHREDALRRFAQREDLYEQALRSVVADYADISRRLAELLKDNNIEELRFVVHTLRGVMGNLGVEEVFSVCSQLEELIDSDRVGESAPLIGELDGLMQLFFCYVNEHTQIS